ncbi:MAG: outer membrane beta-barrel protein [Proteobacteria bacterium]|nr:outer membrane beta-barrel protein [Pseudomonadota bacterium]
MRAFWWFILGESVLLLRLLVVLCLAVSMPVMAHEAGSWVVRVGAAEVAPDTDSDAIDVAGLVTLPGVDVGDNTQVGLTVTRMLTDNLGVGLLAATPFSHDIDIKDIGVSAGDTKHLPPTLTAQYFLGDASAAFRPYVGIGLNTTIFFSEDVDPALNSALDGIVGLPAGSVDADLELEQSWGLALEAGFDYMVNDHWMISGAVWKIDIDTEAKVKTAVATVEFDVEIDPMVWMLSVGYRF